MSKNIPPEKTEAGDDSKGMTADFSKKTLIAAFLIAIMADLVSLVTAFISVPGLGPFLDVFTGILLAALLGCQLPLLLAFMGELPPVIRALPCWTLAVTAIALGLRLDLLKTFRAPGAK